MKVEMSEIRFEWGQILDTYGEISQIFQIPYLHGERCEAVRGVERDYPDGVVGQAHGQKPAKDEQRVESRDLARPCLPSNIQLITMYVVFKFLILYDVLFVY